MSDDALKPATVPAFGCVVYVSDVEGAVRARVANLAGIEVMAASERGVLAMIVPTFKALIAETMQRGEAIPWIEPPVEMLPGEQRRFLPVHL